MRKFLLKWLFKDMPKEKRMEIIRKAVKKRGVAVFPQHENKIDPKKEFGEQEELPYPIK